MTRTPKTAALNLRLEEGLRDKAFELAKDAGMSVSSYVVELLKLNMPLNTLQKLEITRLTMDSPSYFMTDDFTITDVNLAASTLFDISLLTRPLPFAEFWDKIKPSVDNADEVWQNFKDKFRGREAHKCPPVDVEQIKLSSRMFGAIILKKVGIFIATVGSKGWIVTFNIISIENRDSFDAELMKQIERIVWQRLKTWTPG